MLILLLIPPVESSGNPEFKPRLFQFSDEEKFHDFQSVLKIPAENWQEVKSPNFGQREGYGWVKATFRSRQNQTVWLEIRSHFIDSLSMSYFSSVEDVRLISTKNSDFTYYPIKHRYFLFPLNLRSGKTYTLLIRGYVPSPDVLKIPVRLWSPSQFLEAYRAEHWGWALFVGGMAMAILMGLVGFLFHKENLMFLYFSLYTFSITTYTLLNDGWGCFLPGSLRFLDRNTLLGHWINATLFFLLLFSQRFLSVQPAGLRSIFRWSPLWIALVIELCLFTLHLGEILEQPSLFVLGYRAMSFFLFFYLAYWIVYVADAFGRNFKAVWIHLAGIGLFVSYLPFSALVINTGMLTDSVPEMLILRLTIMVDVAFLLISWMYRNKILEQNRRHTEAEGRKLQLAVAEAALRQQAEEIKSLNLQNEIHQQRFRLARDLHDGLGSELTHIINRLDVLSIRSDLPQPLVSLSDFTRATNQNLRDTLWVLNQETISVQEWYDRTLQWLAKRWEDIATPALATSFQGNPDLYLGPTVSLSLFRVTQEAANNSLKYAAASRFEFNLKAPDSDSIELTIEDDGCGVDWNSIKRGYGLTNMETRMKDLAGTFSVQSSPTKGTRLCFSVPALKN